MAAKKPERISLRAYPVGFGDCFLLGFHYAGNDDRYLLIDFGSTGLTSPQLKAGKTSKGFMKQIADDIAATCGRKNGKGGRLHAVVATHRHADHISGFTTKAKASAADESGDVIRSLKPKYVLQPWTEHPDLERRALGPADEADLDGPVGFAATLSGMQACAEGIALEAARLDTAAGDPEDGSEPAGNADESEDGDPLIRRPRRLPSIGVIRFVGEDNIANKAAVTNLIEMGKKGKPLFLFSGQRPAIGLPGVRTHVLGPPTLRQSEAIRKQRSRDEVEFWMLLGGTASTFTANAAAAPASEGLVLGTQVPDRVRWLRDRVRSARVEVLLPIVRALDQQMNNTSLILVFEVGGACLLFPGDAQIENWQYALGKPEYQKLLAKTTLYKVGHHGSRNATPKKGLWGIFDKKSTVDDGKRMWSIVSTMPGKHGTTPATKVPRQTLVDALEKNTTFRNTHDFKLKAPTFARQFEIDPKTGGVTEV
jgi:hypothetical protein